MPALLDIENVVVRYGKALALERVSLTVANRDGTCNGLQQRGLAGAVWSEAERAYLLEHGSIVHQGAALELAKHEDIRRAYFGL